MAAPSVIDEIEAFNKMIFESEFNQQLMNTAYKFSNIRQVIYMQQNGAVQQQINGTSYTVFIPNIHEGYTLQQWVKDVTDYIRPQLSHFRRGIFLNYIEGKPVVIDQFKDKIFKFTTFDIIKRSILKKFGITPKPPKHLRQQEEKQEPEPAPEPKSQPRRQRQQPGRQSK